MIEQQAIVLKIRDDLADIKVENSNGCQGCELSGGCGMGSLGRLFGVRTRSFSIPNRQKLKVGDRIIVGLPENYFMAAGFLIYLLPLGTLFVSALMVNYLFDGSEWMNVLGAFMGLAAGLLWSARLARNNLGKDNGPRFIRVQVPFQRVEPSLDFLVKL